MIDLLTAPHPLAPDLRVRPWAGSRLAPAPDGIGEAWVAWGGCRITVGPAADRTLDDVCREMGEPFVGSAGVRLGRGGFPLLAKIIDTSDWLSVQVHPDDAQAAALEGRADAVGKSEAWLVLDAGPAAELLVGRDPAVSPKAVHAAIGEAALPGLLRRVRPRVGDRIAVPTGLLHAIGPELLVYEIQQPSDITYRVWDWGRTGREIHVAQTLAVADVAALGDSVTAPADAVEGATGAWPAAASPFYVAQEVRVAAGGAWAAATDGVGPVAFTVVEGEASVQASGGSVRLDRWGTAVLAATAGAYQIRADHGPARIVVASVP